LGTIAGSLGGSEAPDSAGEGATDESNVV